MGRLLLALVILLAASVAGAQPGVVQSQLESLGLSAYTNEDVTLPAAGTVKTLTTAKITDANVSFVTVTADGGKMRWTRTGQAPTSSYGNVALDQGVVLLSAPEGVLLQMMAPASVTVTAHVEYYAARGTTPIP